MARDKRAVRVPGSTAAMQNKQDAKHLHLRADISRLLRVRGCENGHWL